MDEQLDVLRGHVLRSAASDWTGVWEAWWEANGLFPAVELSRRLAMAEDVVRSLLAEELIELYRGDWPPREPTRVPSADVPAVLLRWDTWVIPQDGPCIYMSTTDRGYDHVHERG